MTKSGFTGFLLLPDLDSKVKLNRPSLDKDLKKAKGRIFVAASVMLIGLIVAFCLYFGPLSDLNPEALKKGDENLRPDQACSILILIFIAVLVVVCDVYVNVKRQAIGNIISAARLVG
jgi:hypothetical protein